MIFDKHSMKKAKTSDEAILLITGKRIASGTLAEMTVIFQQESARSNSVEVRVKQDDGIYRTKYRHTRPNQAV